MAPVSPSSNNDHDNKKTKPFLQDFSNFWKIHQTQKLAVLVICLMMGLIYHYGHKYETAKLYDFTLELHSEICPHRVRAGDMEDGGWWMCGEGTIPHATCVVYSFGIRDNFSFDHYLARKDCEVHGFDPSPYGLPSKDAYEKVDKAHYHSYGLGFQDKKYDIDKVPFRWPGLSYLEEGNTAEWQLYKLPTIMKQLNHQRLTILKVDIEGGEWDTMQDILNTSWQELYMELHFPPAQYLITRRENGDLYIKRTPYATPPPDEKGANYPARNVPRKIDRINILKRMALVADVFHWDNNNNCQPAFAAECIEIYFKRKSVMHRMFPPAINKFNLVD